jgi:hypothetical protein
LILERARVRDDLLRAAQHAVAAGVIRMVVAVDETSIWRGLRSFKPASRFGAVSANWLSTTSTPSLLISQPMVPPRWLKIPTLRRSGVKTAGAGAGVAAGC